ncbi:hypothetical protein CAEBREN_15934 [Caenorhabditis brenneri]|uniref:Uncharacterized protein n=1 Tax=Caenorhabditis brenneri TaxID=135651 RepID=G0M8K8_CAEBE|nr:hypothetical protein CAEBREN_15934 [Caenorhabditis brenneri]
MESSRKRKLEQADSSHSRSQDPTPSTSTTTLIPLEFSDTGVYYYKGDPEMFRKFQVLSSSLPNPLVTADLPPLPMSCTKSVGMFLLDHSQDAIFPKDFKSGNEPAYYKIMQRMSLEELTQLITTADFHGHMEMLHSAGMAISKKLIKDDFSVEKIGNYLGAQQNPHFSFKDDWRFPPVHEE